MQPVRFEVIKLGGSSLQESKHKKHLILTLFIAVKIDKYFTGYQYYTWIKSFARITEAEYEPQFCQHVEHIKAVL